MKTLYLVAVAVLVAVPAQTQPALSQGASPLQQSLESASYSEGETSLLLTLDQNPKDDEATFGLGVIQFLGAIENLGQALYQYGAVSENSRSPFLRLPVPKNDNPAEISYPELGRMLDEFATGLRRSEATLAKITDDNVKLKLKLAKISFDFTSTGQNETSLALLVTSFNARLPKENPELEFHLDRGDVAWLRAYCHLMCAMVEGYGCADLEPGFNDRVDQIFPIQRTTEKGTGPDWYKFVPIVDAPRLRRMRLHLAAVGELNHETWKHIRSETDDDFEWLPHPKQTDQLSLPMSDNQINAWLNFMNNLEQLMKGERLIHSSLLQLMDTKIPKGKALNFKKVLDDPPQDLFNWKRIREQGFDEKYLEDDSVKPAFDLSAVFGVLQLFNGPFGFARAARMN